jgi:hypothetical protein
MKIHPLYIITTVILVGVVIFFIAKPSKESAQSNEAVNEEEDIVQTVALGEVSFTVPKDFGLAVTKEQILAPSYIPPCDHLFDYCLYFYDDAYQHTNFDSAGIRINRRPDLLSMESCLGTPPDGYNSLLPNIFATSTYRTTLFEPIGDAGAGHYTQGELYRLAHNGNCYEFELRIGESQFANYPEGTVENFTDTDRLAIKTKLKEILSTISLTKTMEAVRFPEPRKAQ